MAPATFLAEAVAHFITAAADAHWAPQEILPRLRDAVTGIDVHPVAAHLARAAWTLAARPAISSAVEAGFDASMSIPVYLGDALQLRFRTGDMFSERTITIQTGVVNEPELVFPVSLVERADDFDALMGDLSAYIEEDTDPLLALDEHHISDPGERAAMEKVIATLQRLHDHGRDHIWAYYTRNMVRPVALSRAKVDVLIGNPPWINYNQTFDILRTGLENLSRNQYGIWVGGHYATQQDVAGYSSPQRRPIPQGRWCHRFRPAPQRVAGRATRQVAHGALACDQLRSGYPSRLHLQAGLGLGKAGTKQLLPSAGFSGVRPQMSAGCYRTALGQSGGAMARQGQLGGRAAGD